jgi:hypothetical protein
MSGQLGKDLSQLMTGIDYGGVQVNGLGFEISGGWGNRPYGAEGWDVYDKTFTDYIETAGDGQHSFTLNYVPVAGTELNFYITPVGGASIRLDDVNFGTPEQTNTNAVMASVVADGITNTYTLPNTLTVNSGDVVVIRQSTSDGSIKPQETDYDTIVTGGDLAYSTATGIAPEDIVLDGDGFNTTTSSPAPEEVVPGQVVDAVAIKVFDRPSSGAANVKIDNHFADGISSSYKITQQPNTPSAVIVKRGSTILTMTDDFTVDYENNLVNLVVVPTLDTLVSIFSVSFSGSNLLDLDYFIGDGVTTEFITRAPYLTSFTTDVYLDGDAATPVSFKTDSTYALANVVGFRFDTAPAVGQIVNYVVVSGNQPTFTITRTERVATDGSLTYDLQYPIGKSLLNESNMIVRADQHILRAPNSSYYTIGGNRLTYFVDQAKVQANTARITDIVVLADGNELTLGVDYTVDLSGLSIKLTRTVYKLYTGKALSINVLTDAEYSYNASTGQITFTNAYTSGNVVEVFSSYRHDSLDIQRTEINATDTLGLTPDTADFYTYKGMFGGKIMLDRVVNDDNYIWVTRNGTLLTPSVDYKLLDDHQSILMAQSSEINDVIGLITFGTNVLPAGIAYMQFKDMLNRVTYKRLNANKQTRLVKDSFIGDTSIEVEDASILGTPNPLANRPGVVEIRGERIEYFAINGNTISQLRRGTMGTGSPTRHRAGSYVQDIGGSETIPYFDTTTTDQITITSSSTVVDLTFTPASIDEIEVFVGGYDDVTVWEAGATYSAGKIVRVGTYTYKCTLTHVSASTFTLDSDNWTFFVGNIRLKKAPYKMFNVNVSPDSPAGDVDFPADFSLVLDVDGNPTAQLQLTNSLGIGTIVTVVKRTGIAWDSAINIQYDDTKVARFLKEQPGTWYTDGRQVAIGEEPFTLDSTIATFDSDTNTFDRGN